MKFSKYFMLAGAAAMLTACSTEDPVLNNTENGNDGEGGYVRIALGTDGATRAEQAAVDNEAVIKTAQFIFYDQNGNYLFDVPVGASDWSTATPIHTGANKCAVIKLKNGRAKYVSVVVNGTIPTDGSMKSATTTSIPTSSTDDFMMFNAVTYNADGSGAVYMAEIKEVYDDLDKASKNDATTTMINVERTVAKVNITSSLALTDDKYVTVIDKTASSTADVRATVEFEPLKVWVAGINQTAYVRKRLVSKTDMDDDWLFNEAKGNNTRSYWAQSYLSGDKAPLDFPSYDDSADKTFDGNVSYAFDHTAGASTPRRTSVIVAGKFTLKDSDGKVLNEANNGNFWLVPMNDYYTICYTEDAAKAAMGKPNGTIVYDNTTGWGTIEGSPIKCMHFNGGLGYYSKAIRHFINTETDPDTEYFGIVRNHVYTCNIQSIAGIGIGIAEPDKPIIPLDPVDPKNENYYVHMSVNVQNWQIVPTQNMTW